MREYKFRGKSLESSNWVYGSLIQLFDRCYIANKDYEEQAKSLAQALGGIHTNVIPNLLVEVDRYTVGQSVEITSSKTETYWEGDVISVSNATANENEFTGLVFFQESTFCLKALKQSESAKSQKYVDCVRFWKDGSHDHHSLEMLNDGYCTIELIGNIYDNPNLIFNL